MIVLVSLPKSQQYRGMASNAKTRRLDCGDVVDRISNLPINLTDLIMKRLSIHEVARMSILSKIWRDIWLMHPHFVFDDEFSDELRKGSFTKDKETQLYLLFRTISSILLAHNGPILKFYIHFPHDLPVHDYPDTVFWIKNISNLGVRKVKLFNFAITDYKMPSYLFSCSELTRLNLSGCILKPPLKFKGFSNLIRVRLVDVTITTDVSFGSQLNELYLKYCTGTKHLARPYYYNNLSVLTIMECEEVELQWFECIQKVEYLCLMLIEKEQNAIYLDKLVDKMPRIRILHLDGLFLESLEPGTADMKRHLAMDNLEYLFLYDIGFYNLVQVQYVICLIRISPNLQFLYLVLEPKARSMNGMNLAENRELAMSSVVRYLQLPDSTDMTLNHLETVEIHGVVGSAELQFIMLLLASSPSLKWMKLFNITTNDPKEQLRISRELMRFPRASKTAQIIWHD